MFFNNKTYNRILTNLLKNNKKAKNLYIDFCNELPDEIKQKVLECKTLKYSDGTFALSVLSTDHLEVNIFSEELGMLLFNFYPITKDLIVDIPFDPKNEIFNDPDNAQDSPAYYNIIHYYPQDKGDICVGYDFFVLKKANGFNLVSQETTNENGYISTNGFYITPVDIEDFVMQEENTKTQPKKKSIVNFLV